MLLNHVALTVSDRDASSDFYRAHFGLTERVHEDAHLLIVGGNGGLLALSVGEPAHDLPRTNHFGFQAEDGASVRGARERFREAGIAETEWQDDGSFVRVQVSDPDGYRVEIYAYE